MSATGTLHTQVVLDLSFSRARTECISDLKTLEGKHSANSFLSSYVFSLEFSIDVWN